MGKRDNHLAQYLHVLIGNAQFLPQIGHFQLPCGVVIFLAPLIGESHSDVLHGFFTHTNALRNQSNVMR